jgi:hypothetical protein
MTMTSANPTIQRPYEGTTIYKYLSVNPDALWIFDDRDGKVIAKFTSGSVQAEWERMAQERRKLYPLTLQIEDPRGWSSATQLSYQFDDQPEQFGNPYMPGSPYYQVKLPLVIEAKKHIVVKLTSKLSYEAYSKDLIYKLNGIQVKPQWHTGKNSVTHVYEAVANFELP